MALEVVDELVSHPWDEDVVAQFDHTDMLVRQDAASRDTVQKIGAPLEARAPVRERSHSRDLAGDPRRNGAAAA
jgi:hypothetical protein